MTIDYKASLCKRLGEAIDIPFRAVSIGRWAPRVAECHRNADIWVDAHPGSIAVRGWVIYADFPTHKGLTAHSIIRGADGRLFDITPLKLERFRRGMRFIEHVGDEELFFEVELRGRDIKCPCSRAPTSRHMGERSSQRLSILRLPCRRD